jgi:hypothetical protein
MKLGEVHQQAIQARMTQIVIGHLRPENMQFRHIGNRGNPRRNRNPTGFPPIDSRDNRGSEADEGRDDGKDFKCRDRLTALR